MTVKKAIIPIAGYGTRRLPITKAIEKHMLPVGNRPVVDYVVEDCIRAGITEFIFVVGEEFDQLRRYYGQNQLLEEYLESKGKHEELEEVRGLNRKARFHYVIQDQYQPYGTATPVWLCRHLIKPGEKALVANGDAFFFREDGGSDLADFLDKVGQTNATAAMAGFEVEPERVQHYGIISTSQKDGQELCDNILEQPKPEDAPTNLASAATYVFSADIFKFAERNLEQARSARLKLVHKIQSGFSGQEIRPIHKTETFPPSRSATLKTVRNLSLTRILVSGSSGLVGSALIRSLTGAGARIARLARPSTARGTSDEQRIPWNPAHPISPDAVSGFDAVIHLAGESIVGRWTTSKKVRIRESRIPATTNLARALAQTKSKPQIFLSASAIGYYGNRGDEVLTEESSPGTGFTADLAREWELASVPAAQSGIRTVQMRTGVVMATSGGALPKMLPAFKLGVGGKLGDGRQWMSWIDLQDVIGAIQHILRSDLLHGPVNLVAPKPVTNEEFSKTLASVLSRPALFPMPAFAARLAFGEMADELLLASQRVEPTKLISSGYPFRFPSLRQSLESQKM